MDSQNIITPKRRPEEKSKLRSFGIELRPSAGDGWWLGYLLFTAYLTNCWKFQKSTTIEYRLSTALAFGLVLQTEAIHFNHRIQSRTHQLAIYSVAPIVISLLFVFFLDQDVIFSVLCGTISTMSYYALFLFVLRRMPKCFTYGEASVIVQGIVIFLANIYFELIVIVAIPPDCKKDGIEMCTSLSHKSSRIRHSAHLSEMEQLITILQVGLLGVIFLVCCSYVVKFFRGLAFYVLLIGVGIAVVFFPIDGELAVIILAKFLIKDMQKLCMIILYIGLIGMTVATVTWQMSRGEKSNTRTRKIFHVLIVLVFMPGLVYQCAFLFVASGVALALMIVLETMRVIQLPPIHDTLDQAVKCFIDEKDAGLVALTPIYLLIGCSAPLWLHPCPCDLTDSAGFEILPLMAGVISVGIGDTAASIVGSKFGKVKWWNGSKTVEGTIAGVIAQALILPLFIHLGFIRYSTVLVAKFLIVVITNSAVETFTDQVDNLVLPLVTFILLSL